MSLLTVAQAVSRNVGIEPPMSAVGDDPDAVKLLQFINETGSEVARRVDWSAMRKTGNITGTGFAAPYDLPPDFSRLISGLAVKANGTPIRGGLTADEWNAITPALGAPRYFQTIGGRIAFHPYPPEGTIVAVTYQSRNWVSGNKAQMDADTDTALIPERLLEIGAIWRFKRHIAADYSDYLAEYEAAMSDLAGFDDLVRIP